MIKELPLADAESRLVEPGASLEQHPAYNNISAGKHSFWRLLVDSLNVRDGLVACDERDRLQAVFKLQCLQPILDGEVQQLRALLQSWKDRFSAIKSKGDKINPYDCRDTDGLFKPREGKFWQAAMLEWSRKDGRIQYVDTGSSETDFSFSIMELTLDIPSVANPFFPGSRSRIAPDGLGVRSNGFLTVFEVKGPDDERDLLGPLLQATCGTLAVVAIQKSLCQALRSQYQRRPAYANARVPMRSSVGIHVMTAKHRSNGNLEKWSPVHEQRCRMVLQAFPELEYIAYSFVVPQDTRNFSQVRVDYLVAK